VCSLHLLVFLQERQLDARQTTGSKTKKKTLNDRDLDPTNPSPWLDPGYFFSPGRERRGREDGLQKTEHHSLFKACAKTEQSKQTKWNFRLKLSRFSRTQIDLQCYSWTQIDLQCYSWNILHVHAPISIQEIICWWGTRTGRLP
jgi:hypothetical protein